MIDALPLLLGPEGYQISRSVRLRSSATAYFNRTLTTPTNNLKWTWSGWVKRGTLSVTNVIFGAGDGTSNNFGSLQFTTGNTIQFAQINGGAYNVQMVTSAVFRDPSAWYHLVIIYDSANATSTDRVQIYVNGVRQSVTYSTGPFAQNTASKVNSAIAHYTGKLDYAGVYFDGYITENNFIDGQALDPSYFGETDAVTGVWKPKKYAGTYGTNGFYLNFSDNSAATAAAIGKDSSGNGNNWTPNNISVTAGVTYDSMLDVPTLWADGGNGRGNYAVLNPLDSTGNATLSNANLQGATVGVNGRKATIAVSSGKWYWEGLCVSGNYAGVGLRFGIDSVATPVGSGVRPGNTATSYVYNSWNGAKFTNSTSTAYGSTYTTNDIISVALDLDNGKIWWAKNGVFQASGDPAAGTNAAFTGISGSYTAIFGDDTGGGITVAFNFGQRPFAYTPPTGFKALNTLNLPTPTILKGNQYFDATTYTGQNTSLSVTNSGSMQPDFVWIKKRNGATDHNLVDSVRGTDKNLISNSAAAESTVARLTSFDSGGFTLAGAFDNTNLSGSTYVGWQWKEGATQGFDIVTYTGTGVARTVAHSLGVAPSMMIVKNRTTAVAGAWPVYHQAIGATNYLFLDLTDAQSSVATPFNDTAPTSTVFSVDGGDRVNKSGNGIVAYLFAEVAGFSKFGSYTGNGSADGPFCFTGFLPRWVMIKRTDSTGDWYIWDTARNTFNLMTQVLFADLSAAESTYAAPNPVIDVLSNGFKQRGTYPHNNASGGTYIYMAFAEHPFKNALAR
jgi:hypothetical protein